MEIRDFIKSVIDKRSSPPRSDHNYSHDLEIFRSLRGVLVGLHYSNGGPISGFGVTALMLLINDAVEQCGGYSSAIDEIDGEIVRLQHACGAVREAA